MMENTHTSHYCLQSHKNFHTKLNSNKTLLLFTIEPLGLQKKVQAWMKHQKWKNSYAYYSQLLLSEKTIVLTIVLEKQVERSPMVVCS